MKLFFLVSLAIWLAPGTLAADKSILELQRDMALLQDQMHTLDEKMATIQNLVQQIARETTGISAKADARNDKFQAAMDQTIKSEVEKLSAPIAGLNTRLDGVAGDVSSLRDASTEATRQISSLRSQLDGINNSIKTLQIPAAAPPSDPLVPASKMFTDASGDMNGKQDLALIEFADFLRLFPTDPMAPQAQFNVGQIHYGQGQFEQAAKDFDAVLANYPDSTKIPDAMLMGGISLMKAGHKPEAIMALRGLVAKFTQSSQASQARDLLRALAAR